MEIAPILHDAFQGATPQVRNEANSKLADAYQNYYGDVMMALANCISTQDTQIPDEIRVLAGIAIKNNLTSKDQEVKQEQANKWLAADGSVTDQIKSILLEVLKSTNNQVASAAAQAVAAIAEIDLPQGRWSSLMTTLVENTKDEQPSHIKMAALQSIGFICERADRNNAGVVSQASGILTAIVQAAQSKESDQNVRLKAIEALGDSLDFIRDNFARDGERNCIMVVVCEATQSDSAKLREVSYGTMSRIMTKYYQFMELYMKQALFGVTVKGMQDSDDSVACMAVEFWSSVCEIEDKNQRTGEECFGFAKVAAPKVLPILLELLNRQNEYDDDEDWSVSMAAAACLQLFAQTIGNDVVPLTLQFVEQNIGNTTSWRNREAAVMAFGSILDGPDNAHLADLIKQALEPILNLMNDDSLQVKDTVAWCLGRISDLVINAIDEQVHLPVIMNTLLKGLQDEPKVITNCCWTIMNIFEQLGHGGVNQETTVVSPYYPQVLPALLNAASRNDNENNARTAAYEALSTLVVVCANDCIEAVLELSGEVVTRLETTLEMQQQIVGMDDRINLEELQINLLGLLTNIIRRTDKLVLPASDRLMTLFLNLLQNKLPNSLIEEDVFIAIGAVADANGEGFMKFMESLNPFLLRALEDPSLIVCNTAVGLVADVSNALGPAIDQFSDQYMQLFVTDLQNPKAQQVIKPSILSCFGDIASSIGPKFERYFSFVFPVIEQACQLDVPDQYSGYAVSEEFLDFVANLRERIIDAFVGIVTGLRDYPALFAPYVPTLFNFLSKVAVDPLLAPVESVARSVVGIIGDVATMYPGGDFKEAYTKPWVLEFIRRTRSDPEFTDETKITARWAREQQKRQLGEK
ncbi:armadillo-type protein [Yarrowia lipolytica]|jgi:importin subunit beta-1|uniref:Importin-95 n=2 Tax=Yarrowia lipolytica TaxID=4952 RepID=Q6C9D2_YARLI|nr:YALI0D12144p [Yarrowia lipolytica CLIB122]AOW03955.1 hypothetical protein YALI1_D15114g [Yarrowia lipolytica]KAB8285214.1 armadillo-type protein [Yarrowia lipolytica]KAE8171260.1 armadillo-type protein [Yarrowia lipolytica]KAJ8054478.1 armadillo-type protein [Yarrowia lipolytica]QNP98431.1 Importin subunit beta-1 [Yarrowia lipolytica]|eukprot:XP_502730.1 YALI0D12144p [Yarrowia lipolytica CLIB122]